MGNNTNDQCVHSGLYHKTTWASCLGSIYLKYELYSMYFLSNKCSGAGLTFSGDWVLLQPCREINQPWRNFTSLLCKWMKTFNTIIMLLPNWKKPPGQKDIPLIPPTSDHCLPATTTTHANAINNNSSFFSGQNTRNNPKQHIQLQLLLVFERSNLSFHLSTVMYCTNSSHGWG